MKQIFEHHVRDAFYQYDPRPHHMSFAWAAGHVRLACWILEKREFTFDEYAKEARKYGISHMNEEYFTKAMEKEKQTS